MDREMLSCVLDRTLDDIRLEEAIIQGYYKASLPHETYPMLVPDVESEARGVLVYGLDRSDLDRIVFFEGEEYELAPCRVRVGGCRCAEALFFDEGIMPPPETVEWSFAEWQRDHKAFMMRQSRVYMSFFGSLSAAEADIHWQQYSEDCKAA